MVVVVVVVVGGEGGESVGVAYGKGKVMRKNRDGASVGGRRKVAVVVGGRSGWAGAVQETEEVMCCRECCGWRENGGSRDDDDVVGRGGRCVAADWEESVRMGMAVGCGRAVKGKEGVLEERPSPSSFDREGTIRRVRSPPPPMSSIEAPQPPPISASDDGERRVAC